MQKLPNVLSIIAEQYLDACSAVQLSEESKIVSLEPILDVLTTINKRPGLVYEIYVPAAVGIGAQCICYARKEELPPLKEFMDISYRNLPVEYPKGYWPLRKAVDWTFTPLGIWEWLLLDDLWRNLPLFWHANYCKEDYILDQETYRCVVPDIVERFLTPTGRPKKGYKETIEAHARAYRKKNGVSLFGHYGFKTKDDLFAAIELARKVDKGLAPDAVEIDANTIEVTYTIWNDWEGLRQITYRAEPIKRRGYPRIARVAEKALVNYNCGICF